MKHHPTILLNLVKENRDEDLKGWWYVIYNFPADTGGVEGVAFDYGDGVFPVEIITDTQGAMHTYKSFFYPHTTFPVIGRLQQIAMTGSELMRHTKQNPDTPMFGDDTVLVWTLERDGYAPYPYDLDVDVVVKSKHATFVYEFNNRDTRPMEMTPMKACVACNVKTRTMCKECKLPICSVVCQNKVCFC